MQLLCPSPCPLPQSHFLAARRVRSSEARSSLSRHRHQRVSTVVFAGDNKRQPNFIDIGGASRGGWDGVKVVRTTSPSEPPKKAKSFAKKAAAPPRTPASLIDIKPEQQNLIVEASKRGRGGKTVTVIKGLQLRTESLDSLCKSLKVQMGSGGAVKDGEIEIQGDHSAKLVEELLKVGYKAKKSGR